MAPPSKLAISTSVVTRLVKEEASYHKEAVQQASRIAKLESNPADDNAEYTLRQERQALQETKNVLPSMKAKIGQAVERLEEELDVSGSDAPEAEVTKAKDAIARGKEAMQESA